MNLYHAMARQLRQPRGFWGRVAGSAMRVVNARPNNLAIRALHIRPEDTILELGFGPGEAVHQMASRLKAGRVIGIEGSPLMLSMAEKRNAKFIAAGKVSLSIADFSRLPLPDGSVDKILAVNVIYFWHDPVAVARECYRVLRPDGQLSIYATEDNTMKTWKIATPETHRLYSAQAISRILQAAGFLVFSTNTLPISHFPRIRGIIATAKK